MDRQYDVFDLGERFKNEMAVKKMPTTTTTTRVNGVQTNTFFCSFKE